MLALTRRIGETLRIGDGVLLTVRDVRAGLATICFITSLTVWTRHGELHAPRDGEKRLRCRAGDNIRLGEHIHVAIVRMKGQRVVLGIDAPTDVRIEREENYRWRRHLNARDKAH